LSEGFGGVDKFIANLKGLGVNVHKGGIRGMRLASANTLNVSNKQVPHEEGDLERDGGTSVDERNLIAAVSYGRTADTRKYAERQHEDMNLKHDSGRNAKFLENALNSTRAQNLQIIAEAIKKESLI
jgi:hypothetical protein